jgi:hypothetical protein
MLVGESTEIVLTTARPQYPVGGALKVHGEPHTIGVSDD